MRRARFLALFLDVLVATVPAELAALALTGAAWRFVPGLRPGIPAIWAAAGAAAAAVFLLRDAGGGRARRWLAIQAVGRDGLPPGPWGSIRRNFPLVVPLWNLYDAWPVLRDETAQRRTDRRTGIRISRIT